MALINTTNEYEKPEPDFGPGLNEHLPTRVRVDFAGAMPRFFLCCPFPWCNITILSTGKRIVPATVLG